MSDTSRSIHKHQRGITLIELLVAIALVGLLSAGIAGMISQLLTINTRTSNHMVAVRQVQQAGKEVSKDALQAQSLESGNSSGLLLTLAWIEWETGDLHEVVYTLENMSGGLKKLQRSHSVNDEEPTVTRIAQYIDPDQTSCVWSGGELAFAVTSTVGGQSETREYKVQPRPG